MGLTRDDNATKGEQSGDERYLSFHLQFLCP